MKRPATALRLTLATGLCSALVSGWAAGEAKRPPQGVKVASDLDQRLAKYAPTEMAFDARTLSMGLTRSETDLLRRGDDHDA